jgi:sugar-specific transcriptional regulator TrmB
MNKIPQELVISLMELGLVESEAKIYIALAMMENSGVKQLIEFLGVSKPNTYESLRLLEEKGLVVLTNTRPMTYQATPPDIGLEILFKPLLNAKNKTHKLFSNMNKENFIENSAETLWYVFGGKSIEYKIKDMIHGANNSIFLASSSQYLKYLEKLDEKNLKLDIIIFTDEQNKEMKLEKIFKGKKGNFQISSKEDMINGLASSHTINQELSSFKEAISMFEFENLMVLVVDDSEVLFIPPVSQGSLTAINTKNEAMIMMMKMGFKDIAHSNIK